MKLKLEHFIILVIVWLYPSFSNSYDLIRIMNRYFDMFEIDDNYDVLVDNQYLFREEKNKIGYYKITSKGEKMLMENKEMILFESRNKFKNQTEFLENVLNKFILKADS